MTTRQLKDVVFVPRVGGDSGRGRLHLFLVGCTLITDCAGTAATSATESPSISLSDLIKHADDASDIGYDGDAVAACLRRARSVLRRHDFAFEVMFAALERSPNRPRSCHSMRADAPFAAFEGWWRGQWDGIAVAHLWFTVEPGAQLVAISDGGVLKRGINLREPGGELCGLVIEPNGFERVHQGRYFPRTATSPAYLKWLTPGRNYYERVACRDGQPMYEIFEEVLNEGGRRWKTFAQYTSGRSRRTMVARWNRTAPVSERR